MRAWPLLAALLFLAAPAAAQTIDLTGGGPLDITARDGIEWRQAEQVVIARGGARAVRDGTAVEAQRLIARYRPREGAAPAGADPMGGAHEIWRLEAEGDVRITTATDTATGARAVYDMDQAVLVLSGGRVSLATPQQTITARDSLEYWTERRMAVARGDAVVTTQDNRRITAEVLVAYLTEEGAPGGRAGTTAVAQPRPGTQGAAPPPPGQGRIDRIEAFGNVEIRSDTEVVRGDRGVYSAATGIARLLGDVRITRGQNQLNGREAIVNLNTGVSRIVSQPGQRVQGLVVPQSRDAAPPAGGGR